MILLIEDRKTGETYTESNVTRIDERRTGIRTLVRFYIGTKEEHEGELDLFFVKITPLPDSPR